MATGRIFPICNQGNPAGSALLHAARTGLTGPCRGLLQRRSVSHSPTASARLLRAASLKTGPTPLRRRLAQPSAALHGVDQGVQRLCLCRQISNRPGSLGHGIGSLP